MNIRPLRFAQALGRSQEHRLQPFAEAWGISAKQRPDRLMERLEQALNDPEGVSRHIHDLSPMAQAAIAFLAMCGGLLPADVLVSGLGGAGYHLALQPRDGYALRVAAALVEQGVIVHVSRFISAIHDMPSNGIVFSDERVLRAAPQLACARVEMPAAPRPEGVKSRRPGAVVLDILALLQAIDAQNGLGITRSNTVRVADMRKLARALSWQDDDMRFDGLLFRQALSACVEAFEGAHLLTQRNAALAVADLRTFSEQSNVQQVRDVLFGFAQLAAWREGHAHYWNEEPLYFNAVRLALLGLLASLPDAGDAFYSLDDLSAVLFERIGEFMSLHGPPRFFFGYSTKVDRAAIEQERRADIRQSWQENERAWLEYAVSGWLYFLGIVDVGLHGDRVTAVRLSEFGRRVLLSGQDNGGDLVSGPAWMIQPDFEVLVYLEHATSRQLALIERLAERVQVAAHTARYKLSRDSIYTALEQGTSLEAILDGLAHSSSAPVPQNVSASIREWAAQRDRVSVSRDCSIMEYPTAQARDEVLAGGINGRPIGDRYIVLSDAEAQPEPHALIVDYTKPMTACLAIDDTARVTLERPAYDLLLRPILDRWAERDGDDAWIFTPERVAAASGRASAAGLLAFLEQRAVDEISPWMRMVLRSWAGERVESQLGRITALRFHDIDAAYAVETSPQFYGLVLGSLGARTLLVDRHRLDELRELLDWAKFDVKLVDE